MDHVVYFLRSHIKPIILIFIVLLAAILILIWILDVLKSTNLIIQVTPTTAQITIDGAEYHNGNYRVYPNNSAHVVISQDGFETKEFNLTLESNHIAQLSAYLTGPNNDFSWYESHQDDYNLLKEIADDNAQNFINKTERILSIRNILPISYSIIKQVEEGTPALSNQQVVIQDGSNYDDCQKTFCLAANSKYQNSDILAQIINSKGYNISDYRVVYSDFISG